MCSSYLCSGGRILKIQEDIASLPLELRCALHEKYEGWSLLPRLSTYLLSTICVKELESYSGARTAIAFEDAVHCISSRQSFNLSIFPNPGLTNYAGKMQGSDAY
jgi:hypothetical protein